SLRQQGLLSTRSLYFVIAGLWRHGFNMLALLYQAAHLHATQNALCIGYQSQNADECVDWQTLYRDCLHCAAVLSMSSAWQTRQKVAVLCRNQKMSVVTLCTLTAGGMPVLVFNADMSTERLMARLHDYRPALILVDDDLQDKVATPAFNTLTASALKEAMEAIQSPGKLSRRMVGPVQVMTSSNSRIVERKINPLTILKPVSVLLETLSPHCHHSLYLAPPFYHGYGLTVMYLALCLRKQILLTPRFHAPTAARLIRHYQADMIVVVPAMLLQLLNEMPDNASLKSVLTGSAPLSLHLAMRTRQQWGELLYNLYSTAESGFALLATPEMLAQKPNSIGRPFPGVKVLLRKSSGEICATNEIGELWLETSWSARKDKCALFTGDLAYQDADGDIFLKGRADDMAVCGGEKVYPQDVCAVVLRYPEISQAAVIAIDDETFGQRVAIFAQSYDNKLDLHDMRLWLTKYLARYQMPARIVLMRHFPVNEAGKVNKEALLTQLAAMTEKDGWAIDENDLDFTQN
ncbi:MAG TPA: hypothetical protein DD638_02925, partial [Pasteurellaceae bacterium]|nr:hypothetical protein [Pasteurellaceae bacterium]